MLDIGWSEILVIVLVALVVIGPKDLPRVARTIGQWTAKARGMAREFQRNIEDMAREADLADIKKDIDKITSLDVGKTIKEQLDPGGSMAKALDPRDALSSAKDALNGDPFATAKPAIAATTTSAHAAIADATPAEASPVTTNGSAAAEPATLASAEPDLVPEPEHEPLPPLPAAKPLEPATPGLADRPHSGQA